MKFVLAREMSVSSFADDGRRCCYLPSENFAVLLNPLVPARVATASGFFFGKDCRPQVVTDDNDSPPGSGITNLTNKQAGYGYENTGPVSDCSLCAAFLPDRLTTVVWGKVAKVGIQEGRRSFKGPDAVTTESRILRTGNHRKDAFSGSYCITRRRYVAAAGISLRDLNGKLHLRATKNCGLRVQESQRSSTTPSNRSSLLQPGTKIAIVQGRER